MTDTPPETPSKGSHNINKAEYGDSGMGGGMVLYGGGADGPAHFLALRQLGEQHTLAAWVARYLAAKVYQVQSPHTLDAKSRDLTSFVQWFVQVNGHGDIRGWLPRDTQVYLRDMEQRGRAPTSVNRAFASLRHFARWVHAQPHSPLALVGLPTEGVRALIVDEADAKKLDKHDIHKVLKAAENLVSNEEAKRKNNRARRNRAILTLLYTTGLRVSELVALRHEQYDGRYLLNVKRKGKVRSKSIYVPSDGRRALDDYLANERGKDDPDGRAVALFVSSQSKSFMTRRMVAKLLLRVSQEACKFLSQKIHLYPHRLRHTFGSEYRARTGSDTETAVALGHTGLQYVGRYVRKTQQEREAVLESITTGKINEN